MFVYFFIDLKYNIKTSLVGKPDVETFNTNGLEFFDLDFCQQLYLYKINKKKVNYVLSESFTYRVYQSGQ